MRALAGSGAVVGVLLMSVSAGAATPGLPEVKAPVQAPSLPTPSLPKTPFKLPATPKLPSAPAPGNSGGGGSAGGVPALPAPLVGSGSGSGSTGNSGSGSGSSGSSEGSAGGGSANSPAESSRAVKQRQARERRFQSTVKRLSGCFPAATHFERRVLTLRAGLAGERPRSRAATARHLSTSMRRVGRAEQSGVHRLRRASRSSACSGPAPTVGEMIDRNGTPVVLATAGNPLSGKTGARRDDGAVLRASASSGEGSTPAATESQVGALNVAAADERDAGAGLPAAALALWALALLALLAGVAFTIRRRRAQPAATSAESDRDVPPAPWAG